MYKIGELSKLCNIPVKTLRYYDAEGLLIPDEIDKFTGYRYYSASKLEDCYRIIALKALGFSLDEIRVQLTANDNEKITAALNAKLTELQALIETTQTQIRTIASIKNNLTKGESKMFHIIVRATEEVRVAYIRKNYPSKSDAFDDIEKIKRDVPKTILGKRTIIVNYETEYRESDFDLAVCAEITGKLPAYCEYGEKTILSGADTASLICKSDELDDAYKAIIQHLDETNYEACGAYFEIYHEDGTVELKLPVRPHKKQRLYARDAVIPFTDDPEVCGTWEFLDIVPTREHFVYGKPKCWHSVWLQKLYFIDGGQPYWVFPGWTKGKLYTLTDDHDHLIEHPYTIETAQGRTLMFLEIQMHDNDAAELWVYEQTSSRHITSKEEVQICDNTEHPFVIDEKVLGVWNAFDFIRDRNHFDPTGKTWKGGDLYLQRVEFLPDGRLITVTKSRENMLSWTKGLELNKYCKTACAYEIVEHDGKEFLILEWKSGDYSFAGKIHYYVFTRESCSAGKPE